jgi:hypothetical protein
MERTMEQIVNVKFCVILQKSPGETLEMLKTVYGEFTMSKSNVLNWHKHFTDGREGVNNDERQGATVMKRTEENIMKIRERVQSDHQLTFRTIAYELDMSTETVRKMFVQDLGMRKLTVKFMIEKRKDRHLILCMDFPEQLQEDNFLDHIITSDETWCYQCDPEAKCQSVDWRSKNSPKPKKPWMSNSKIKTILICFFDIRGIIRFEYVSEGTSVSRTFYRGVEKAC